MNGRDYVAVRRLSTKQDTTLAAPGDTCENVPEDSLGWLLDRGWIKPAPGSMAPRLGRKPRKE
jgi:hypothetical protein